MSQPNVILVSHGGDEIVLLIGGKRVIFSVKPDLYWKALSNVKRSCEYGYYNQAVTQLVRASVSYRSEDGDQMYGIPNWSKKGKDMVAKVQRPSNSTSTPDDEHKFTLIAPEAQNGLVYQGQRVWHASEEASIEYAKAIFNANKDAQFSLVVVQAVSVHQPKPQIELQSLKFA